MEIIIAPPEISEFTEHNRLYNAGTAGQMLLHLFNEDVKTRQAKIEVIDYLGNRYDTGLRTYPEFWKDKKCSQYLQMLENIQFALRFVRNNKLYPDK